MITENQISQLRKAIRREKIAGLFRRPSNFSRIYFVGREIVAKWVYEAREAQQMLEVGEILYNAGVQIPKIYGTIPPDSQDYSQPEEKSLVEKLRKEVSLNRTGRIDHWFILMQRINGRIFRNLNNQTRETAKRQRLEELEKVLGNGILPGDYNNGGNSIYDSNQGRLYLIDLNNWRRGSIREIEEERRRMRNILI